MKTESSRLAAGSLVAGCLFVASSVTADYQDEWGPDVGTALPEVTASDSSGTAASVDNLMGEKGLLLVFSRSSSW